MSRSAGTARGSPMSPRISASPSRTLGSACVVSGNRSGTSFGRVSRRYCLRRVVRAAAPERVDHRCEELFAAHAVERPGLRGQDLRILLLQPVARDRNQRLGVRDAGQPLVGMKRNLRVLSALLPEEQILRRRIADEGERANQAFTEGGIHLLRRHARFAYVEASQLGHGRRMAQSSEREHDLVAHLRIAVGHEVQQFGSGRRVANLSHRASCLEPGGVRSILSQHHEQRRHRRAPAEDAQRARRLGPQGGLGIGEPRLERLDDARIDGKVGIDHHLSPLVRPGVEERRHLVERDDQAGLARQVYRRHPLDGAVPDFLLRVRRQRNEPGQGAGILHLLQRDDNGTPHRRVAVVDGRDEIGRRALHLSLADVAGGLAASDRIGVLQVVDQALDRHLPRLRERAGGWQANEDRQETAGRAPGARTSRPRLKTGPQSAVDLRRSGRSIRHSASVAAVGGERLRCDYCSRERKETDAWVGQ